VSGGGRRLLICALAAAAFSGLHGVPAAASTRTDLDQDWSFRADPDGSGESSGWSRAVPADTESISVPHTWNIGGLHDYLGVAWYFRRFEYPQPDPHAHVELHFGAAMSSAVVWLNGKKIGAHDGGFTGFSFDITRYLSRMNVLAVRIDNRPGIATIPGFAERGAAGARYDWWTYGGLVRDVWLSTTGRAWIDRQSIRSSLMTDGATVRDRIVVKSAFTRSTRVTLRVTAQDSKNRPEASETRTVALSGGTTEVDVSLRLAHPQIWSIDQPNLHHMVVEIMGPEGRLLDETRETFGVRSVEIRERHLILNGERVRLTGLARHEDSPWEGLAETAGTMRHDLDDMKLLHTTLSRPVHYPQHPFVFDYADSHGILLVPEIPLWQFSEAQLQDPRVLAGARQQMREMIEQAGNHPSIFAWSVVNESAMGTPGGIAYFRAMKQMIRELDPERFVTFADDNLAKLDRADTSAAKDADFLMMNQYYGSWHGPAAALVPALDKINALFPDKMVIISEMGFAGIFAKNAVEADQARIRTMQDQMPLLAARDWIAGAILWCYQDYKSPRNLWPGDTEGYVEHGVVDEARQRKPSYEVWKQLTSPAALDVRWVGETAVPAAFTVLVTPNSVGDLPYYPLRGYRLIWSAVGEKGRTLGGGERGFDELEAPVSVDGTLSSTAADQTVRLNIALQGPTGAIAAQRTLEWPARAEAAR
jgi:beta-glucuronidase